MKNLLTILVFVFTSSSILFAQNKDLEFNNLQRLRDVEEISVRTFQTELQDWEWFDAIEPKIDFPFNFELYQFIYTDTFRFEDISKEVLFERALELIAESGGNLENIVKYSNKSTGVLIGEAYINFAFDRENAGILGLIYPETTLSTDLKLSINFRIIDNGVEVEIIPRSITDYFYSSNSYTSVNIETPLIKYYPLTNVKTGKDLGKEKARLNAYKLIKGAHNRVLRFNSNIKSYFLNTHLEFNNYIPNK